MKKKILLFSAMSLTMLAGCTDSSVTTAYDSDKPKAKITLAVVDGNSNEAIESAEVVSQFDDKASLSDEFGFVVYKKNEIGDYIFEVSKKDYSTTRVVIPVKENVSEKEVTRVPDVAVTVPLYKADVTVSGHVYYRDLETGNLEPASKVEVVLSYGNTTSTIDYSNIDFSGMTNQEIREFMAMASKSSLQSSINPSEIKVTTDSTGAYKFENVAEMVNFQVTVLQSKIDSKLYAVSRPVSSTGIRSGHKAMDMLILRADGEVPALLKTNTKKLEQNSALEFEFTLELEADSLEGNWVVKKGGSRVLTTASLSKDKKTVIIKPLSESWTKKAAYTVEGVAYTKDGMYVNVNENFSVGTVAVPGSASDLKVSLDTTDYDEGYGQYYNYLYNAQLMLKWKAPSKSDVDGYRIYYKSNEMDDFELFETVYDTTVSKTPIRSMSVLEDTSLVSLTFVVIAYNTAGESSVASAKQVTWKIPDISEEDDDDEDDDDEKKDDDDDDDEDDEDEDDEDEDEEDDE